MMTIKLLVVGVLPLKCAKEELNQDLLQALNVEELLGNGETVPRALPSANAELAWITILIAFGVQLIILARISAV